MDEKEKELTAEKRTADELRENEKAPEKKDVREPEESEAEISESLREDLNIPDKEEDGRDEEEIQHPDYKAEIVRTVRSSLSPLALRDRILEYHENDIAEALSDLTADERGRLFNLLDTDTLTDILEYAEDVGTYFGEMSIKKQLDILNHSEADTAVDYLRALPRSQRKTLIDLMDDDTKKEVALIGSFDEDEIGSRMTTNYIRIPLGITVREAMHELVAQAAEHDNISTLYVVDGVGSFYGAIDLKDLIIAREGTSLKNLVMSSYPYVYAHEQVSDCIERIKAYYEDSIPVLDDSNHLLGVITAVDVVEIADDEMGEDYARLAGLSAEEDLQEPIRMSIGKRLPWLVVLLFLGLLVSSVVGVFEHVVEHLALIVSFQSLVLDMAGNVGTQSLAVTIRVLMDEALTTKQRWQLVGKEVRVGTLNGLTLGLGSFIFIGLYILLIKGKPADMSFAISACTGTALLLSMVLASFAGTTIPMLFKKLGVDPAVASGPLITTINDLTAVVAYYGLTWVLLINVLHF